MKDTKSYSVAGFAFTVTAGVRLLASMKNMAPFECPSSGADAIFTLEQTDSFAEPFIAPYFCTEDGPGFPEIAIFQMGDGSRLFRIKSSPEIPVAAWLEADHTFSKGRLYLSGTDDNFGLNNAVMLLFAFSTALRGALEMHSSVVMNGGKGYLFLGRSGTGKSTHSRLWFENIPGTELLNDDNPVLRLMEDGSARVYGTPWSGKAPCYKNLDVPVGAIVRIRQAPENSILKLPPLKAYASILASASTFRPFADLSEGWHRTVEGLAGTVPCYTLDCLPDAGAALLCHRTVNG